MDISKTNVKDTALIFEGGGMRGVFTAAIANILNENEIFFDYVAGISAGSSNTVNYISRDIERTKKSYIDIVDDPNFGGIKTFLRNEGFFNSSYIYEEWGLPNGAAPFNMENFLLNPAKFKIGTFNINTGKTVYWGREYANSIDRLMKVVRASSSMPFFMPKTEIEGELYYDGGLGGGIPLDIAQRDGYEKFFIVRTRKKDYRKEPMTKAESFLLKTYFKKYPQVYKAMEIRYLNYNNTLDEISKLEREGRAFVVYPEEMFVENKDTDKEKLVRMYNLSYGQGLKEVENWKDFLKLN
ncbi:patatin-like phospholipase family protein [Anaerosphaera multitolerans]|uniref:Patatin family protein n=1 Tax=Anaerosphaera multitolerans TaxID=2487351 RepID=A0A437S686_9FIRM|nr:patatin family protein [Anaerosphaera multitolerans]RVU54514.1 patatin family protein [Anaerosphaera multitolerans]